MNRTNVRFFLRLAKRLPWPARCGSIRRAKPSHMNTTDISRRGLIKAAATGVAVATTAVTARAQLPRKAAAKGYKIKNKRIRQ
ncbi:MAG TPA: hypothetical protein DGJ56_00135, partial [Verrucomicrobiales bacterium]|nr:hypothetical protein [Verrucomicrobiales bacterium]